MDLILLKFAPVCSLSPNRRTENDNELDLPQKPPDASVVSSGPTTQRQRAELVPTDTRFQPRSPREMTVLMKLFGLHDHYCNETLPRSRPGPWVNMPIAAIASHVGQPRYYSGLRGGGGSAALA